MTATLSACIIARDEEQSLPECLASVGFCEEIVLVDSGSTDATVAIGRAAGARVIEQPWLGFAAQRNVALDHAHGDWVLEIDADERVSAELRAEIERFLAATPPGVELAGLPLREIFLGHALGPSAKYPKYRHRLLRRGSYRHDEARTVHEGFIPEGVVHPFDGDLMHLLAAGWSEAVGDAWRYSRLEAGQLQGPRSPAAWVAGALVRPAVKLLYRLLIDGGWRDGWAGLAKISLDCATDSVVWTRHLLGRRGAERGRSGVGESAHYGSRRLRLGSLRVVGVAADPRAAADAQRWLARARAAGADVTLVGPRQDVECMSQGVERAREEAGHGEVRIRALNGVGPVALIRALDAEDQLRPFDVVVAFGARAGVLLRLVPGALRGELSGITQETRPDAVNWRTRADCGADHR
jgi:glycosyltransferase involved in cell wall biosynthesis